MDLIFFDHILVAIRHFGVHQTYHISGIGNICETIYFKPSRIYHMAYYGEREQRCLIWDNNHLSVTQETVSACIPMPLFFHYWFGFLRTSWPTSCILSNVSPLLGTHQRRNVRGENEVFQMRVHGPNSVCMLEKTATNQRLVC